MKKQSKATIETTSIILRMDQKTLKSLDTKAKTMGYSRNKLAVILIEKALSEFGFVPSEIRASKAK